MKLSDIMGHAGLSSYAEVALVLFLFAFLLSLVYIFGPWRRETWEHARLMPLDDDHPQTPRSREE